jgi:trk system potassium uptake protein TrkH
VDLRPVLYVIGIFLSIQAASMIFPMLADLYMGSPDWKVFFLSMVITAFFGGALILSNAGHSSHVTIRQAFLLIFLSWIAITVFGALPFLLSELEMSFTDAFFETMSGVTTTGSTVMTDINHAPRGILLWRAILQWLGGVGVIIMAMSVLPFLNVGGMQIFRTELSENEKVLPRAAQLASSIGLLYVGLTILCIFAYMFAGMGTFDAVAHAMTTISTGGYSTYDESFAHYHTPWLEIVAIIFMIVGGLPFVLYLKMLGGNINALFKDSQVQTFLSIVAVSIIVTTSYLAIQQDQHVFEALRRSTFNIISLITGTGFVNGDYNVWGGFAVAMFFFLMVLGACAGSTTCGIKIFRFQVLFSVASVQVKKLLHPHGVFIPHYNGKPIPPDVPMSVMSFFFLYALCFSLMAIALSYSGLDFLTAMSGAVTAISNVGPGLGETIGPSGNFASLPDSAKWILSIGMLIGRLEIFPVLVLITPHFWKH